MQIRMSTKNKLLGILAAILVGTFLATSLINYHVTRESVRKELMQSALPLTGKNIYSEIHSVLMRPILAAEAMSNDTFLWHWIASGEKDPGVVARFLREIKAQQGFMLAFFVSHVTDRYFYNEGVLKEVNPRDPLDVWYYAFLRTRKNYMLNVDPSEAEGGKLSIFVNARVEDETGKLLGVAGVGMDMTDAARLLGKATEKYGRLVYLVDQDGLVQVHPDISRIERYSIRKERGLASLADAILRPADEPRSFEFDRNGRHILLSAHYISEFDWYLLVEQDEAKALAPARDNLVRTLCVGAGASILILLLCLMTVNRYQGRIEALITTDALTGAANRRGLDEAFLLAKSRADRKHLPFSIILIDFDEFKSINDTLGHMEGDRVLSEAAQIIQAGIRPTDTLARWGGDEFLILLEDDGVNARAVACRINEELGRMKGVSHVSCSCGIAEYNEGDTLDDLVHRADKAMYEAKESGGGTACSC